MAAIVGNDGSFAGINAVGAEDMGGILLLNRWRATFSNVISEVTGFNESMTTGFRRNRTGLLNIEGSASGAAHKDVAKSDPDAALYDGGEEIGTLTLSVSTTATACTYAFAAVVSAISFDVNKLGDTLITFDFTTGDGDVAAVWDET